MGKFLVTFDLKTTDNESINKYYSIIEEYLQSLDDYCKPTNNVYLVSSNKTVSEIRDSIKMKVDNNCYVFVAGVDGKYASYNLKEINCEISSFFDK